MYNQSGLIAVKDFRTCIENVHSSTKWKSYTETGLE
jgi:hypothetical protein